MKKTTKQYSEYLSEDVISELRELAYKYGKVKNYIYSRYGSIEGLKYLKYPREVRDEWVKNKFADQWGLSARYWKLALEEAFSNIKTNWSQTNDLIRSSIQKRHLTDDEIHYINYVLKANSILYKILRQESYQIDKKFDGINQVRLNKLIRRLVRKYHHKSISKKFKSFMIDNAMYSYKNGGIEIASLTKGKRFKIKLTDNNIVKKGNLRVVIRGKRIEIHRPIDVKIKPNTNTNIVGVDKGYKDMLAVSSGDFYGQEMSIKLIDLSDSLSVKNKQRNKLHALVRKHQEKGNYAKADKIKKHNLGTIKYFNKKDKIKADIESFMNHSLNQFIEIEKPCLVIAEDLSFVSNKHKIKRVNRWLSSWTKGVLQERLEYKLEERTIEIARVNPAYTSQICHKCHHFGERIGDKFHCKSCGVVNADYNASKNIEYRYYDSEITLFTPYKKVKEILLSRLSEDLKKVTVPTKNREIKLEEVGEASLSPINHSDSELHRNTKVKHTFT